MNVVISDTAEYGCYLFDQAARPLLKAFVSSLGQRGHGRRHGKQQSRSTTADLIDVNAAIRTHSVEVVGARLRGYMTGMKAITSPQ